MNTQYMYPKNQQEVKLFSASQNYHQTAVSHAVKLSFILSKTMDFHLLTHTLYMFFCTWSKKAREVYKMATSMM